VGRDEAADPEPHAAMTDWHAIAPADATELNLAVRTDITAPLTEDGERCPWPWEPQQLVGQPLGQYHCPYCGAMVIAGMPHIDYREDLVVIDPQGRAWCDGPRHLQGDRPRAMVAITVAGPVVVNGQLCVDCAEQLGAQHARAIAEATRDGGPGVVMGGTISISPLAQAP